MTASNEPICFPVWSLPETVTGLLCKCHMGALRKTLRDPIIPLVGSKGSPPRTNDLTRPPVAATAKKKRKSMHPGCLAHVVSGMFYSAVANRRQPNLYIYIYKLCIGGMISKHPRVNKLFFFVRSAYLQGDTHINDCYVNSSPWRLLQMLLI